MNPFADLRPLHYGAILVDPPWLFEVRSAAGEAKSPQAQYDCMPLDEMKRISVDHLAAPSCLMFMWATWPMLQEALELMKAWRFSYKTGGAWHKKTVHGKDAFGTGYIVRCASEPFLIGTIGKVKIRSKSVRNIIEAEVREHSRKPDEHYGMVDRLVGDVPKVELFATQRWPGWTSWGNSVDKYEVAPSNLLPPAKGGGRDVSASRTGASIAP